MALKAAPISICGGGMREFFSTLLNVESANSRFVHLCQGVATAVVILMVGVAFVCTHDSNARDGFANFMLVLTGGGSVGMISRGWQKRLGTEADAKVVQANTESVKAQTVNTLVEKTT